MNTAVPAGMQRTEQRYLDATPKSRALFEKAKQYQPDGVSRSGAITLLYPVFIERAERQYLRDLDGRRILDLSNGHSAFPLGHAHPAVVKAVQEQAAKGIGYALVTPLEVELAELLARRVPSMQRMRFTVSGTEATMFLLRLARAFTGRPKFARMESSYHGMHDTMCTGWGQNISVFQPGTEDHPVSMGLPRAVRDEVLYMPFNDLPACAAVVEKHAKELAAIITEPMIGSGGAIPPEPGFLQGLRELCNKHGVLLIFDEMITMGMAMGGGQEFYGVYPDLTASGKILGGGTPMGVFGGRADIMALTEQKGGQPVIFHTGTWNGHPLSMAAGIAQMKALTKNEYDYLGELGGYFRDGVRKTAARLKVPMQVTGAQHFSCLHYTSQPVKTGRDARRSDFALARRVALSLLSQGYYMVGGRSNLSTAVTRENLDRFFEAFAVALEEGGAVPD